MSIPTRTASQLCGLDRDVFRGVARLLGMRPVGRVRVGRRGPRKNAWDRSHILAVLLLPVMKRLQVADRHAAQFAAFIGKMGAEQLEARLAAGRSYLMIVGTSCPPELFTREQIVEADAETGGTLKTMGLSITGLNISELYADLARRIIALQTEGHRDVV
jgi:hypothetical protein